MTLLLVVCSVHVHTHIHTHTQNDNNIQHAIHRYVRSKYNIYAAHWGMKYHSSVNSFFFFYFNIGSISGRPFETTCIRYMYACVYRDTHTWQVLEIFRNDRQFSVEKCLEKKYLEGFRRFSRWAFFLYYYETVEMRSFLFFFFNFLWCQIEEGEKERMKERKFQRFERNQVEKLKVKLIEP